MYVIPSSLPPCSYLSPICIKVDHDVARVIHVTGHHSHVVTVNVQMESSALVQRQSHTVSLSHVTQWVSHSGLGL